MAGLYIHIPFCESKCAYCDFYSIASCDVSHTKFIEAVMLELDMRHKEISQCVNTVYIGGGTPSVLGAEAIASLLDGVSQRLNMREIKEFTFEANPEDVDERLLNLLCERGVNRVSVGVQTFQPEILRMIGRRHNADKAHRVLRLLSDLGINFSADLIFGLPGQSLEKWKNDVDMLLSYRPHHFSAYLLSIEPSTRLGMMLANGLISEAGDEEVEQMYEYITSQRALLGYEHYEVSNYALPGFRSKHNSAYWNSTPYLGLGPGAHSFDGQIRRVNPSSLNQYIKSILSHRQFYVVEEESARDRLNDYIFTSLRTSDGIDIKTLRENFAEFSDEVESTLRRDKRVIAQDGRFFLPERLFMYSDAVIRDALVVE